MNIFSNISKKKLRIFFQDYFREPVVKSPPEPTRVRSPEGSVRSPDPINWTVPLDTGKTFSVTQSVKDGGRTNSNLLYFLLWESGVSLCPLLIHHRERAGERKKFCPKRAGESRKGRGEAGSEQTFA